MRNRLFLLLKSTLCLGKGRYILLLSTLLISGCTTKDLDLNIGASGTVIGKIDIPANVTSFSSLTSQSLCSGRIIKLYNLNSDGTPAGSVIATTEADQNGFFIFEDLKSKGLDFESNKVDYLIEAENCNGSLFTRALAGNRKIQNINLASDLIHKALQISALRGTNILNIEKKDLYDLEEELQALNANNFLQLYNSINAQTHLRNEFTRIFGFNPNLLTEMLPIIAPPVISTTSNEGQTLSAVVYAEHWYPSYDIAFEWKLDGTVIASTDNLTYTFNKNSQGPHLLRLRVGKSNGSGGLDLTVPYFTKTYSLNIQNTFPPIPLAMTKISPAGDPISSRNLVLGLTTGTAKSLCESFSKLALTEEDLLPPLLDSSYTITCLTDGNQNLSYTLMTSGDGTKVLRLWAKDSAGNISSSPTTLSILIDSTPPNLTWASPVSNSNVTGSATITGQCESGRMMNWSGAGLLSPFSYACPANGTYAQIVFLSAGDGSKSITVSQSDDASNTTTITKTLIRDTTPPNIVQSARNSPYSNNQDTATFGGTCEAGLDITVSRGNGLSDGSTTCTNAGTWTYVTATQTLDASRTYTFTQTDAAGNSRSVGAVWIRDTVSPQLSVSGSTTLTTASNSATFTGSCETGITISVSGSLNSTILCSAGSFTFSPTSNVDGTFNYNLQQTDNAGNSTSLGLVWTRATQGPAFTLSSSNRIVNRIGSASFSGTCSVAYPIQYSGSSSGTLTCSLGNWTFAPTATTDATRSWTLSQTDGTATTTINVTWVRDTVAPVLSGFSSTGGNTIVQPLALLNFSMSGSLAKVTHFCLKSSMTTPGLTDNCWISVSGPTVNQSPQTSLSVSNYGFNIGLVGGISTIYAFAKDEAGNISTNTNTTGNDKISLTYNKLVGPVVSFAYAFTGGSPANPLSVSNRTATPGQSVYIRWKAQSSDTSLTSNPIKIGITYDGANWQTLFNNLVNGSNAGCVVDDPASTLDNGSTGCVVFAAPTSQYFQLLVTATDTGGRFGTQSTNMMNTSGISILAGNTFRGKDGPATKAMFSNQVYFSNTANAAPTRNSFVVTDSGDFYRVDFKGLWKVASSDGILQLLIPATGTRTVGNISSASLYRPRHLALDYSGRLLIMDTTAILRLDLSTQMIEQIIGGGSSTADTLTDPLDLQFQFNDEAVSTSSNNNFYQPFFALPDGRIFFRADYRTNAAGYASKYRIYNPSSTNKITSFMPTGTISHVSSTQEISSCRGLSLAAQFDVSTGVISKMMKISASNSGLAACPSVGTVASFINPDTYQTQSSPASPWPGNITFVTLTNGMDGKIYANGDGANSSKQIRVYNSATNSWDPVVGSLTAGSCIDETSALTCDTEFTDLFVSKEGKVYWFENSRLRSLDSANQVRTIYGQTNDFGDNGNPLLARFNLLTSVDRMNSGEILIGDSNYRTIRAINASGTTISKIAGNAGSTAPVLSGAAASTSIRNPRVVADPATGSLFHVGSAGEVLKLNRSTGLWEYYLGSGTGTLYTSADNLNGADVRLSNVSVSNIYTYASTLAYLPTGLVTLNRNTDGGTGFSDQILKIYDHSSNRVQKNLVGKPSATQAFNFCSLPSTSSNCDIGTDTPRRPSYYVGADGVIGTADDEYVLPYASTGIFYKITNGQVSLLKDVTATGVFHAGVHYKSSTEEFILYCYSLGNSDAARIRKFNFSDSSDTELNWTIPAARCAASDIHFDPARRKATFILNQEGLYGIAEIDVP